MTFAYNLHKIPSSHLSLAYLQQVAQCYLFQEASTRLVSGLPSQSASLVYLSHGRQSHRQTTSSVPQLLSHCGVSSWPVPGLCRKAQHLEG